MKINFVIGAENGECTIIHASPGEVTLMVEPNKTSVAAIVKALRSVKKTTRLDAKILPFKTEIL